MAILSKDVSSPGFNRLPRDVCELLSAFILSWSLVPEGEGKSKQLARERATKVTRRTLKGLILVSKINYRRFMPALLTHLVLKADHLSSFLRLLKSDPTAGFNVKSIEFPLEVNRRESVLEVVPIPAVYCARVEHPSLDNLDPKFKRIMVKLKQTSVSSSHDWEMFANYLSHVRGLLLESMPNLESLKTNYIEAFPFHRLPSFTSLSTTKNEYLFKLKHLVMKSQASNVPQVSTTNLIWILLFLPQLETLDIDVVYNKKDWRYFESYHEQFSGKSNVLELKFRILFDANSVVGQKRRDIFKGILSTGRKFQKVSVDQSNKLNDNAVKLPFQTLIEGLSNSRSSLKHLDCFGLGLAENAGGEDPADFSSLTVLESICIDSQVVFTWSEYFKVTFPPKLQCLQLYNNDTLLAGSFTPENAISAFLLNHKLNPGFELKTYREIVARNMEGSYRAPPMQEMNRKSWQRCRNELVKECRDLKVKLTLMELEE